MYVQIRVLILNAHFVFNTLLCTGIKHWVHKKKLCFKEFYWFNLFNISRGFYKHFAPPSLDKLNQWLWYVLDLKHSFFQDHMAPCHNLEDTRKRRTRDHARSIIDCKNNLCIEFVKFCCKVYWLFDFNFMKLKDYTIMKLIRRLFGKTMLFFGLFQHPIAERL